MIEYVPKAGTMSLDVVCLNSSEPSLPLVMKTQPTKRDGEISETEAQGMLQDHFSTPIPQVCRFYFLSLGQEKVHAKETSFSLHRE